MTTNKTNIECSEGILGKNIIFPSFGVSEKIGREALSNDCRLIMEGLKMERRSKAKFRIYCLMVFIYWCLILLR